MAVRSGVACPWGACCKFGLRGPGVCTGVHSADDERHFEGKREGMKREKDAACAYCVSGTCRFGSRCRRGMGGDSDYESESSGADADAADEETGPKARAPRPTARARTPRSLHVRSRSGFRKLWSRPVESSCSAGEQETGNYYAPLQADFMDEVICSEGESEQFESSSDELEPTQTAAAEPDVGNVGTINSRREGGTAEMRVGDITTKVGDITTKVGDITTMENKEMAADAGWLVQARARARSGGLRRKGAVLGGVDRWDSASAEGRVNSALDAALAENYMSEAMSMPTRMWRVNLMSERGRVDLLQVQKRFREEDDTAFAAFDGLDWGQLARDMGISNVKRWVENKCEEVDERYLHQCRWCREDTIFPDGRRECNCDLYFGFEDLGIEDIGEMSPLAAGMKIPELLEDLLRQAKGNTKASGHGNKKDFGALRAATASPNWVCMFSTWGSFVWWRHGAMKVRRRRRRLRGAMGEWHSEVHKGKVLKTALRVIAARTNKRRPKPTVWDCFRTWDANEAEAHEARWREGKMRISEKGKWQEYWLQLK